MEQRRGGAVSNPFEIGKHRLMVGDYYTRANGSVGTTMLHSGGALRLPSPSEVIFAQTAAPMRGLEKRGTDLGAHFADSQALMAQDFSVIGPGGDGSRLIAGDERTEVIGLRAAEPDMQDAARPRGESRRPGDMATPDEGLAAMAACQPSGKFDDLVWSHPLLLAGASLAVGLIHFGSDDEDSAALIALDDGAPSLSPCAWPEGAAFLPSLHSETAI